MARCTWLSVRISFWTLYGTHLFHFSIESSQVQPPMRLRGVVLFAVAALVTGIDANLSVKSKETVASALSDQFNLLPLGGDHAPARRFLRATDADEDEEEEERVGPSASIVDKFKGLISSKSATESLEQWVTKENQ